jgi:hypothetical protein
MAKNQLVGQNYLWRFLPIVIGWKYTIGNFEELIDFVESLNFYLRLLTK